MSSGFQLPTTFDGAIGFYSDKAMKRFAFLLSLIFCLNAAYAFTLDGIVYSDSISSNTVSVSGYTSDLPADVVIPSDVTYEGTAYTVAAIDSIAFKDCTSLKSIEIPSTITRIAVSAFDGCSSLTSAVISDGNDALTIDGIYFYMMDDEWPVYGEYTILFEDCPLREVYLGRNLSYLDHCSPFLNKKELSKVTIGRSVTDIGRYAFADCTSLVSIEIPNNVTSIGERAFYYCSSLTSVKLPDSITEISDGVFWRCENLSSIVIPGSVKQIGESAFYYCSSLTSIKLPDSITEIKSWTFAGCKHMSSIEIPDGVTKIGYGSFQDCSSLTTITLPNSVTEIGDEAFGYCDLLTSIILPGNVTRIGKNTFEGCVSFSSFEVPVSITSIDDSAFKDCTSLASIHIPNGVTGIGSEVFSGCTSLASIEMPDGITTIEDCLFRNCTSLTSIVIPDNVKTIIGSAFSGCTSLTSVSVSDGIDTLNVWGKDSVPDNYYKDKIVYNLFNESPLKDVYIGRNLSYEPTCSPFRDKKELTKVRIGNMVTKIGEYMFSDCISLASIEIPGNITSIGNSAFAGCSSLASIEIPDNVVGIGSFAFGNCTMLKSVVISEGNNILEIGGSIFKGTLLKDVYLGRNLTYGKSSDSPFFNQKDLTEETIGNRVTALGNSLFEGCSSIASMVTPDNVTKLGNSAFKECSSLKSISISKRIKEIENYSFAGCASLASLNIPDSIVKIGRSAFAGCTSLTSLEIPNNVMNIVVSAFKGCTSLESVIIPDCDDLLTIDKDPSYSFMSLFMNGSLKEVYIGRNMDYNNTSPSPFYGNRKLSKVTISNNVTEIGPGTFMMCTSLASIEIPNSVTRILCGAFNGCISLESIKIPKSVSMIYVDAFKDCRSLSSAVICDGNTNLKVMLGLNFFEDCPLKEVYLGRNLECDPDPYGKPPFHGQKALSKLTIGNNVTEISEYAFLGCNNLSNIYIYNDINIGSDAFATNVQNNANLVVLGNKDLVLSISDSQWWRFEHVYYEEDSRQYLPISWNTKLECPEAFYYTEKGCLVSTEYNAATVSDHSSIGTVVIFRGKVIDDSLASGDGFKFEPSTYWRENIFETLGNENEGNSYNIVVSGAGQLSGEIGMENLQSVEYLTVSGDLNGTDIKTINSMALLKYLDISAANIVEGGEAYQDNLTTKNNVFGDNFFRNMENLAVVMMPNAVKSIGRFVVNKSVKVVILPDSVTRIGDHAFSDCTSLTSVEIPGSVLSIAQYAFLRCSSLKSIDISDGDATLSIGGDLPFKDCPLKTVYLGRNLGDYDYTYSPFYKLKHLSKVTVGNRVTKIGGSLFSYCISLKSVEISNNVTHIGSAAFRDCTSLTSVVLPDNVMFIGDHAFDGCASLPSINIPKSITEIKNSTFYECASLSSVIIPNGVTEIGDDAFYRCTSLKSVEIPNSVTRIGRSAFSLCSSLTSLEIPGSVRKIDTWAFSYCESLKSVEIPNSVIEMGSAVFNNCYSLISVSFPNSLTKIGDSMFERCSSLTSIEIPNSVLEIGLSAFRSCLSLKSVEIPNSVTKISNMTFQNCKSLTSVIIPDGVTTIGVGAFEDCTSLASIEIPNSVTELGENAFQGCSSLISVIIPDGVTTIRDAVFKLCTSLESIEIPRSITRIEDEAFYYCNSLNKIKSLNQTPPLIYRFTFRDVDKSKCQLIVPKGSLEKYKGDQYWKEFLNMSDDLVVLNRLPEMKYGDAGIDLAEYAPEGVALVYESSDNNVARIEGTKLTICGVGEVTISASLAEDGTPLELIDPVRKLVVGKAELTATAQSYEIKQGEPMPEFAIIYDGFVYDDNADSLQELPVASCEVKDTSLPGEYEISITGGYDPNYNISTVNGRLTIIPVSGVSDIEGDAKPFSCVVADGQIMVSGLTTSQTVAIYDANGRICYRADAVEDGKLTYRPDNAGVYIVRSGSQSIKVIVR